MSPESGRRPDRSAEAELSGASVLLLDDDPASLELLATVLRRMGISDVRPIGDPFALEAEMLRSPPDLVLLDWHMPGLSGAQVLAMVRSNTAVDDFVPIVILTADATREVRDAALAGGADDFLVKPFDLSEVRLRVRNLLRTRRLHSRLEMQRRVLTLELLEHDERSAEHERWLSAKAERVKACLAPGGLSIVYQPIVDLRNGQVMGAEALSRFDREPPQTPDRWFSDAAEVGLGVELELAALRAALLGLHRLPPGAFLSLNVSPQTVVAAGLADLLEEETSGRLVLELTEHDPIDDYKPAAQAIARLRDQGLRLAVDDAGAGFASLRHILRLAPDVIKLDIALTRDIDSDPVRRALASALVSFADDVGAAIVAEGIETTAELETLRRLGIELGQGYRLARPMPLPIPSVVAGIAA